MSRLSGSNRISRNHPERPAKPVRNLAWLVRNAKGIRHISIILDTDRSGGAYMVVSMHPNTHPRVSRYECEWADSSVLWEWLHRRTLIGVCVYWNNTLDDARCERMGSSCRRIIIESIEYAPMP